MKFESLLQEVEVMMVMMVLQHAAHTWLRLVCLLFFVVAVNDLQSLSCRAPCCLMIQSLRWLPVRLVMCLSRSVVAKRFGWDLNELSSMNKIFQVKSDFQLHLFTTLHSAPTCTNVQIYLLKSAFVYFLKCSQGCWCNTFFLHFLETKMPMQDFRSKNCL